MKAQQFTKIVFIKRVSSSVMLILNELALTRTLLLVRRLTGCDSKKQKELGLQVRVSEFCSDGGSERYL